jgi:hypothetical protein
MSHDDPAAGGATARPDHVERRDEPPPNIRPARWVTRVVVAIVLVAAAYLAFRISAAFFPRWWAQRVAAQVDGDLTSGTAWGLFYGFLFTFVPLLLLAQVRRHFLGWTGRVVVVVVAVALAAPNWLTLSVVAGSSRAAHAGERIFDVDAPGFRAATLVGVLIAAALALALVGTGIMLRRRKGQVRRLRGERDELRRQGHEPGHPHDGSA